MKKILFSVLMLMATASVSAQSTRTVKGAVIDKSGNPLPGAEVSATSGAESTTTDADGTFTLEVPIWLKSVTARYAGKRDKKMKTSSEMIFRMSNANSNSNWVINAIGGLGIGPGSSRDKYTPLQGQVGLLGAYLGKWGGYAKVYCQPSGDEGSAPNASIGVTKQIYKKLHVGLGAGLIWTNQCEHYYSYNSYYNSSWSYATSSYTYSSSPTSYSNESYRDESIAGIAPEISFFYIIGKHISLSIHYAIGIPLGEGHNYSSYYNSGGTYPSINTYGYTTTEKINHCIQLGVGYAF